MKSLTTFFLTLMCLNYSLSQNQEQQNNGVVEKQPVTTQNENQKNTLAPEKRKEVEYRITQIDSHLNSIKIKREHILNNADQKAIAEKEGWFEDMDRIKKELEKEKEDLEKLLAN